MRKTRHRRRTRRRRSRKMRGGVSLASLNPFTENDKGEGGWLSKLNPFGKKKTAPVTAGRYCRSSLSLLPHYRISMWPCC